jgi:glycosyltransferase involved in cell wall biosynthesis
MREILKISVVVPCFNMKQYIRNTLDSIIHQRYNNLELIIIDGASTDGTLEILKEYDSYISCLVSEKDGGQYFAVNKGLKLATGDIVCWLNADDIYFPWTFRMVSKVFMEHSNICWISGATSTMDDMGKIRSLGGTPIVKNTKDVRNGRFRKSVFGYLQNEGMFWRRAVQEKCGVTNTTYKLAADFELWTRFAVNYDLLSVTMPLASFRVRKDSRSISQSHAYEKEVEEICLNLKDLPFLIKVFPNSAIVNKIFRLLSFRKGLVYFFNPVKNRFAIKLRRTNMSFYRFIDLLRFVLD